MTQILGGVRSADLHKERAAALDVGPLPTMEANYPYHLAAAATLWLADADGYLRPQWLRVYCRPGVNGFPDTKSDAEYHVQRAQMFARVESEGYRIIPLTEGPDGSYLRFVDVQGGGRFYHPFWDTCYAGDRNTTTDKEAADKWIRDLIERHVIERPTRATLDRLLAQLKRAHTRQAQQSTVSVMHRATAERIGAAIATCEAWLADLYPRPAVRSAVAAVGPEAPPPLVEPTKKGKQRPADEATTVEPPKRGTILTPKETTQ